VFEEYFEIERVSKDEARIKGEDEMGEAETAEDV